MLTSTSTLTALPLPLPLSLPLLCRHGQRRSKGLAKVFHFSRRRKKIIKTEIAACQEAQRQKKLSLKRGKGSYTMEKSVGKRNKTLCKCKFQGFL